MSAFSSRLAWPITPNALSLLRAERRSAGLTILDFSESNPTRVNLPRGELRLLSSLADSRNLLYEPDPRGLSRARETLAASYGARGRRRDGCDFFLCASTSEAYGWLFKLLCDPGDAVLVPRPGYPLFEYLAALESVEVRPYRLEYRHPAGWSVDLDSVASAAGGARALVLINPNNPTGSYISRRERDALVELCARYDIAIIADEVFFDFPVEGGERESFLGEDRVLTFVLDGLSKSAGLPQIKLGWIGLSGPPHDVAEASGRLEIVADAYLSAGTPAMNALPVLLDEAEVFRSSVRERSASNLSRLRALLEGPDSPHRVLRCQGGWTALIESPRFESEEDLALGLLRKKGLWSQPGYFFDMEREAFFSASLILPPELLEAGAEAYRAFFAELSRESAEVRRR
ncbi:MAG: pyridoxal phosphate-dependent aminotransferase [Rectinemataceae bacterium]